jgi:hypothetical protein
MDLNVSIEDLTGDIDNDQPHFTASSSTTPLIDSAGSTTKTQKKRKRVSKTKQRDEKKSKKSLPPWVIEIRSALLSILWHHPKSDKVIQSGVSILASEPIGSSLVATSSAALDLLRAASNTTESAYVAHARFIISHVLSSPATRHLFSPEELALFEKFQSLSPQAAGLAIRVFQRKGPWMRTTSFRRYVEDLFPNEETTGSIGVSTSDDVCEVIDVLDDKVTEEEEEEEEEEGRKEEKILESSIPPIISSPPLLSAMGSSSLFRIIDAEREAPGSVSGKAMAERLAKRQSLKRFGSNDDDETKKSGGKEAILVPAIWVQNAVTELINSGIARGLPSISSSSSSSSSTHYPQQQEKIDSLTKTSKPSKGFAPIFNTPQSRQSIASKSSSSSSTSSSMPKISSLFKPTIALSSEVKLPFSYEETLAAISCAFTADELRSVAQRLGLPTLKTGGGSSFKSNSSSSAVGAGSALASLTGRAALISQINSCMRSQRSVMGGPLPLTQAFTWVLTRPGTTSFDYSAEIESLKSSSKTKPSSAKASPSSSTKLPINRSNSTPHMKENRSAPVVQLMRLQPSFSSLLRRAHCLFYIAPSSAMLSSGMGSGTWPFSDEADTDEDIDQASASSSSSETICIIDDDDDGAHAPIPGLRALETMSKFRPNFDDYLNEEGLLQIQSQKQPTSFLPGGSMSKYSDSATSDSPLLLALNSKAQASLSSPGLALIFRKLDVCPSISPRPIKLFSSRLDLTMWEFANLFRAQTDAKSIFSYLPPKVIDVKADRAEDVQARILQFPWEVINPVKENEKNNDEAILIDDDDEDAEDNIIDEVFADDKIDYSTHPPLLAGISLLPFALQLIGVPPSHPLSSTALSNRDAKICARFVLEATSKIEGNMSTLGSGQAALFGVGASSLLFLLKSLIHVAAAVASGVPTQANYYLSSPAKAKGIAIAIFSSSPSLLVAYRASLCLALHTVSTNVLTSSIDRHPFLHQFSPGSLYSTILWEAIDPLERSKQYPLAVLFLSQLTYRFIPSHSSSVDGRFTPHRSGRWWARLSMNLSHLGLSYDSQFVVQESLRCVDVRAGDRYLLAERNKKLIDSLQKKKITSGNKASYEVPKGKEDVSEGRIGSNLLGIGTETTYIPLYHEIVKWSKEVENPLESFSIIHDSFVHAPLATAIGAKSSFLSTIDVENDGSEDELAKEVIDTFDNETHETRSSVKKDVSDNINITVQVFQQIGLDFSCIGHPSFFNCEPVWISEQKKRQTINETGTKPNVSDLNLNDLDQKPIETQADVELLCLGEVLQTEPSLSTSSSTSSSSSVGDALSRRWIKTADGRSMNVKSREVDEGPSFKFSSMRVNVEELSLLFYNNPLDAAIPQADELSSIHDDILKYAPGLDGAGWRGLHCEGSPIRSIFALLFWDVLFPPQIENAPSGAFVTAFQDAPLDLDSPSVFYSAREGIIRKRLCEITKSSQIDLCREIGRVWRERYGQVCRGIKWSGLPMQALQIIAMGLGGPSIACLCDAFCFDYRHLTGGMPDLLLWRISTSLDAANSFSIPSSISSCGMHGPDVDLLMPNVLECSIEIRLVEVKGPRDHLSEKQIVWLKIFQLAGINHGVIKILESRKAKGKNSKTEKK